jgi:folate-dependent tRNA-U54 methylase TrmFO/GidA
VQGYEVEQTSEPKLDSKLLGFVFSGTGFNLQFSSRGRIFRMIPGFKSKPLRV